MIAFLLACLRSDLAGGGGGGPFTIISANLSTHQVGTDCSNPYKWDVSLVYTGSPAGKTVKLEQSFNGGAYTTIATGISPSAFPYTMNVSAYYNKFGTAADTIARVTDETNALNTATSDSVGTTYNFCA